MRSFYDLILEQVVQGLSFDRVQGRIIAVFLAVAQRPADFGCVGFGPPAVEFRQIDAAVDQDLHTAGSTGLPRPTGRINPDIDASHQMLCQQHVIVAQENHMLSRDRLANELQPPAN